MLHLDFNISAQALSLLAALKEVLPHYCPRGSSLCLSEDFNIDVKVWPLTNGRERGVVLSFLRVGSLQENRPGNGFLCFFAENRNSDALFLQYAPYRSIWDAPRLSDVAEGYEKRQYLSPFDIYGAIDSIKNAIDLLWESNNSHILEKPLKKSLKKKPSKKK